MKARNKNLFHNLPKNGAFYCLVILCIVFGISSNSYLTISNLFNVCRQMSSTCIIAMCSFLAILTHQTDLSVGATAGLTSVVFAIMATQYGLPIWLSCLIALCVGLLMGALNGILCGKTDIPPFIITLGTMGIAESVGIILTSGRTISLIDQDVEWVGRGSLPGGIPIPVVIMLVLAAVLWYILMQRRFGIQMYAVGGNAEAALASGINVSHVKLVVYLINGALATVAGFILASRLGSANPSQGMGLELEGICAAILGGTALAGGKGSIWGAVLGAITLVALRNGLNIEGISSSVQMYLVGIVILFILVSESVQSYFRQRGIENENIN